MTIRTDMITFAVNGASGSGYLALPEGDGKHPAVVVIQEWWGLVDHIKDVTERFARAGYIALAPDLYHGEASTEPDDARRLAMALDRVHAFQEIQGAIHYLTAHPDVEPKQVGVIGFCMGGAIAMMSAYMGTQVGAVASFYGGGVAIDDDNAPKFTAPVLGIFGELDQGLPVEKVRANEAKLHEHGKVAEFHIYPDAQHAFFNDSRPHVYHAEASVDAWQRTLAWFQKYLV